eukprot:jgi/Tetstr1/450210/TSEL_037249.t1
MGIYIRREAASAQPPADAALLAALDALSAAGRQRAAAAHRRCCPPCPPHPVYCWPPARSSHPPTLPSLPFTPCVLLVRASELVPCMRDGGG